VDKVTQFQAIAAVERMTERFLIPALEAMIATFPFHIQGFHADNGSEYVNHQIARLLNKLNIEFTNSRPRHSNDNALAECKNAAVVREHLGYAHIFTRAAQAVNAFTLSYLVPYVNFHRSCFFPLTVIDKKGRQHKRYPFDQMMMPCDKLRWLRHAQQFLRPGTTLDTLDATARKMSNNEAATQMNQARTKLFASIHKQTKAA